MAKIIISDENEGRRNLLANTLEREGFDVTRGSTLKLTEGTALATMPEVVVIDDEWKNGDALDTATNLMSDPEFAFKCRIVMLSRNTGNENLVAAAKAGVHEVLGKPLNMTKLIEQLWKHSKKQFVPPPADISRGGEEGGFSLSVNTQDGSIALPMLQSLLGPESINEEFVEKLKAQLEEDNIDFGQEVDNSVLAEVLRIVLDLLLMGDGLDSSGGGTTYDSMKSSPKLGEGATPSEKGKRMAKGGTMEEVLQNQADAIEMEIEGRLDAVLDDLPDRITYAAEEDLIPVDPELLKMTKSSIDFTYELLWALGRPDAVADITLLTQLEDATEMMGDALASFSDLDLDDDEEDAGDDSEEE